MQRSLSLLTIAIAIFAAGCVPPSAPTVDYNQADAELLHERLSQMDWE